MLQAKAAAHPMRLRILRLCLNQELTNKELADRLATRPGTTLYHVRLLVRAGLLEQAPVRTGASGALEKPYRSTGLSWWLDGTSEAMLPLAGSRTAAMLDAFRDELAEAGPDSVQSLTRFVLHLSPEELVEFDRRIAAVLDEYVQTDDQRLDRPALGGMVVLHALAE